MSSPIETHKDHQILVKRIRDAIVMATQIKHEAQAGAHKGERLAIFVDNRAGHLIECLNGALDILRGE